MQLPLFFTKDLSSNNNQITLDETASKHIIQVLRMKEGEELSLTDGKGKLINTIIETEHKKAAVVRILSSENIPRNANRRSIAISPIKNASRFEWFLEKATEIGIDEIILLICHRTEKINFRLERMQSILTSAMLQSQQPWLPEIYGPVKFDKFISNNPYNLKCIAHCLEGEKRSMKSIDLNGCESRIILIGPEGDFTKDEVASAIRNDYMPVSLGNTRLRTETAGIVAITLLQND